MARNNRKNPRYRGNGDVDRYNYVDRNIYSSAGSRKRKGGIGKKIALTCLFIVLLAGLGVFIYAKIMTSRMDRQDVNTQSYVEQPSSAPTWEVKDDDKITNILLIGADKNDDGSNGRSDTMMLASIDNKTKTLRLVSFLRDSYLEIPTVDHKAKLNYAFLKGGPALTMQTLENNFRINIDKFIQTDFENFATIIDKMGGIDVEMTQKEAAYMNKVKHCKLKEGNNYLRGTLALYFARMRSDALGNDFGRTGRQRQVIGSMLAKLKKCDPLKINSIMYDYLPNIKTNLQDTDFLYLASIATKVANYPMKTMHIPSQGTYKDGKTKDGQMVLELDIEKNSSMLREFLYGEKVSTTEESSSK